MNHIAQAALKHADTLRAEADQIEREVKQLAEASRPLKTVKTMAPAKRAISAEGRKRIADAQKKRWAAHKGAKA